MPEKMIIGLGYKMRAGKDTTADFLVENYGFKKIAFADALKDGAKEIFGLSEEQVRGDLKAEIDGYWNMTPRQILQQMGTECMRKGFADDIWVRAAKRKIDQDPDSSWVITDCRFPNEAQAVQSWNGYVVQVENPNTPKFTYPRSKSKLFDRYLTKLLGPKEHSSETAMKKFDDWDYVLHNDSSFDNLYRQIDTMIEYLDEWGNLF